MDSDFFTRMLKLSAQGFQCAQILMILALESDGKEDADLVRAAGGLNMGFSDTSGPCGALTGGCCFISYFTGKGDAEELGDPRLRDMLSEYAGWFRDEYGTAGGACICREILQGNPENIAGRCPGIVQASYMKALEILGEN